MFLCLRKSFHTNKILIFINLASGCKAIIFTCKININNKKAVRLSTTKPSRVTHSYENMCKLRTPPNIYFFIQIFYILNVGEELPSLCCIASDNRNYRVNTTFVTADCQSRCVCTHDAYLACIPLCPKAILKCPVGFIQQKVSKTILNKNKVCYCHKYECVPISGSGTYLAGYLVELSNDHDKFLSKDLSKTPWQNTTDQATSNELSSSNRTRNTLMPLQFIFLTRALISTLFLTVCHCFSQFTVSEKKAACRFYQNALRA